MPDPSTLTVFFVATLALLVVPGPAVLYIVARGIDQGRERGWRRCWGSASAASSTFRRRRSASQPSSSPSATAFAAVKYLGAAYLVFLGVRTLLSREAGLVVAERPPRSLGRIFVQGIVVQVLNPKMALFVFAFLPQFVDPARGSVALQTLFFGGLLVAMGACTDSTYAMLAGSAGSWLKHHAGFVRSQRYVAGTVYLGLGVTTALVGVEHESSRTRGRGAWSHRPGQLALPKAAKVRYAGTGGCVMTIQLSPQTEALIQQKVASGLYRTPEAAIDAAVRLLDQYDRRLVRLRASIREGFAAIERGEGRETHAGVDGRDRARGRRSRVAAASSLTPTTVRRRRLTLSVDAEQDGHRSDRLALSPWPPSRRRRARSGAAAGRRRGDGIAALGHRTRVETIELGDAGSNEIAASFAVSRLVAARVAESVGQGALPLVLAGNCNTAALGVLGGLAPAEVGMVWFDAHADFNTADTTASGFFAGMALAISRPAPAGAGCARRSPVFAPSRRSGLCWSAHATSRTAKRSGCGPPRLPSSRRETLAAAASRWH